ncbi:MAG: glycosyltransferase [Elusimicrobiota bacterium]
MWSKEFFLSRGYDVWNIFPSGSDRSCGFFAFKIFSQSQRHRLRCRVSEISGGEQNRFYFAKNANSNLVSIIILCYNQIDYTKQCLNSIKLNTKMLYELIIVDNGSSDDTVDYLRQQADITLIMNETNKGVAGGWNQGIKCASGDYILILNNDVIVTDDWLENMVECLERNKESGAVGPMSNYVAGHQLESNITYVSLNELYSFAKEYHSKNRYRQQRVDTLIGFCLLLKRETVEKVGLFDERYGIGNFEDNDYCIRMIQQGFRLYIAKDSFIHHFGSRSFAGNNINYEKQMVKNYKIFLDKWKNAWDVSLMDKDLLVMGYDCIDQNKLSEAEKNFEQAVQINPQNFEALNNLGCIRYQQSRDAEAFELLKKALEINPLYELALLNLMDVARELGKEKEAERYMEKAASLDANLGKR